MAEETILGGKPEAETQAVVETPAVGGEVKEEQTVKAEAFDYGKMVGADGALAENWREGLPEGIRGEKCLDSIKTIGTLAQSYVHAQHWMGGKISVPGEHATQAEWDAFYKACGRPDSAESYKTGNVPEGVELDGEQVKAFQEFAFKHGFTQKTYEAAVAFDLARAAQAREAAEAAQTAEYNETLGKLRTEFGGNMETVVAQCNKAMNTFGLTDVLREKGLLNNYTVIKALAGIGERISESKLKGDGGNFAAADPEVRMAEIMNNPDDPYYKREHPGHNARVAEMNRLLAQAAQRKKGNV